VNRDCRLIYEAYTSPGVPTPPAPSKPLSVAPVRPPAAENEEKKDKKKSVSLEEINSDRKAVHIAYEIVDAIYKTVDSFDRATDVISTISAIHRNERKRQQSLRR